MQDNDLTKQERRVMLGSILAFLSGWYMSDEGGRSGTLPEQLRDLGLMLVIAFLQWLVARHVWRYWRKKYPHYTQLVRRVVYSILVSGALSMIIATLVYGIPMWLIEHRLFGMAQFRNNFGPCFFFSALIIGAHEVIFNFYELRRIDREKEELKKAHLQSQLDSLKTQVNPHFLFNSINTVLSLIPSSPQKAEAFLIELSSVYRYLLQANENQLTTLQQELQFARSYFHLLKTRFGNAIQLEADVDEKWLQHQLPSLTLQLLLENAVKHNVVSMAKPLTITLRTEKQPAGDAVFLTVQNNLQRKVQAVPSHKMGLNNILSKFRLLNGEEVLITDKDNCFTVTLPLFKNKVYERIDY
ncbi:MAG TPA: histidine kinase [Flavisolibacter sp.]|nr:histidine kinase [Flavisolibacter sp.]